MRASRVCTYHSAAEVLDRGGRAASQIDVAFSAFILEQLQRTLCSPIQIKYDQDSLDCVPKAFPSLCTRP
jgi:hypothetical protein